jgi:hypothetical protein
MRLQQLLSIATLAPSFFVLADVVFTSPKAGSDVTAGSFTVTWKDGTDTPSMSDLTTYTLQLMVGGNEAANSVSWERKTAETANMCTSIQSRDDARQRGKECDKLNTY